MVLPQAGQQIGGGGGYVERAALIEEDCQSPVPCNPCFDSEVLLEARGRAPSSRAIDEGKCSCEFTSPPKLPVFPVC